jgi:predicted nicotinamide N-methyase
MLQRVAGWFVGLSSATVLIGDPGRSSLPKDRLEALATWQVPVSRRCKIRTSSGRRSGFLD